MSKLTVHDDVPDVTVNVVPVKIQYTGEANTQAFFTPSKVESVEQDKPVVTAEFRGLHLKGQHIPFNNKTGYICTSSEFLVQDSEGDVKSRNQYTSVAKFGGLTVFGHDAVPPSNSKWRLANEWDSVAKAIHGHDK